MVSFQYKGRIHKSKFSIRSLRYAMTDQAARAFPSLQTRWLFPVESTPIESAAVAETILPSMTIEETLPAEMTALGLSLYKSPLRTQFHVYDLLNVMVTGWAGAVIKDGHLLTTRSKHNWVAALRARPHRIARLDAEVTYFNLMATTTAKGHIFHWLYDAIIPLMSFLESGAGVANIGLLVNRKRTEIQNRTLDFIRHHYGITAIHEVDEQEAAFVPNLVASVPRPHFHRALQSANGVEKLDQLADFLSASTPATFPDRVYISRSDARLRRVVNEDALAPAFADFGLKRVTLKGMLIPDQVAVFRNAKVVVAPHGAGLAHITWCRPGTRIIEFFPDPGGPRGRVRNATSDYWIIAQMRGLEYTCFFGGPLLTRDDGFEIGESTLRHALTASAQDIRIS